MIVDIAKIPKHLKSLLVNSLILPFWYVSIYLYCPKLYRTEDIILISSVCICLTIVSALISSLVLALSNQKESFILDDDVVIPNIAFQSILLTSVIFCGYIFNILFNMIFYFYSFLLTYFGILIFLFIVKASKKEFK